ncbi:SH2 domain-containing protein 4A isoform X2 [Plectropomus leopardus]|uniref:SH2 domain-containing protein 4A isoform X2 n=1 Tax=Plectropomus leopardus TaxID=160734 RepID=UPI001C4DAA65|nr:SH2 domain-containing protein 4A isoform X2 [Plectropomus leopardus]
MLQQILKDMYIDPDVLNALNEDQKKTLFLKMRQEQVRRWKEMEEKLEREGGDAECKRTKPKKANSKNVSWLLGRDGDVAVIVIGEVDELSSKFICSGFGEKKTPGLQNNANHQTILKSGKTTEAVRTERENLPPKTQPGISLNLKVSVSEQHSSPPAAEKPESKSASATEEKSVPQPSICSRPPMRASPVNVRPASANAAPGSVNTRPGVANLRLANTAAAPAPSPSPSSAVKIDSGSTKGGLHSQEPQKPQESQGGKGIGVSEASRRAASEPASSSGSAPTCAGRGRVAQLMKTFSAESTTSPTQTPPRGIKPPLPTKPSHLRLTTTPTVR